MAHDPTFFAPEYDPDFGAYLERYDPFGEVDDAVRRTEHPDAAAGVASEVPQQREHPLFFDPPSDWDRA